MRLLLPMMRVLLLTCCALGVVSSGSTNNITVAPGVPNWSICVPPLLDIANKWSGSNSFDARPFCQQLRSEACVDPFSPPTDAWFRLVCHLCDNGGLAVQRLWFALLAVDQRGGVREPAQLLGCAQHQLKELDFRVAEPCVLVSSEVVVNIECQSSVDIVAAARLWREELRQAWSCFLSSTPSSSSSSPGPIITSGISPWWAVLSAPICVIFILGFVLVRWWWSYRCFPVIYELGPPPGDV